MWTLLGMLMVLTWGSAGDPPGTAGGLSWLTAGGMAPARSVFHRVTKRERPIATPWGAPLKDGPRTCLLIAPRGGLGDAAMLRLHLGLEVTALGIWSATTAGREPEPGPPEDPEWTPQRVTEQLLAAAGKKWDLIILGNLSSRALPETVLSAILDRVAAGSGLLITHLRDEPGDPLRTVLDTLAEAPDGTIRRIEAEPVPGWTQEHAVVRLYRHGKGRIVETAFPGELPEHTALLPVPEDPAALNRVLEDDLWSYVCRLVLLAAGWAEPVSIATVEDASPRGPAPEEIPPDLPEAYVQSMYVPAAASGLRPVRIRLNSPLPEPARAEIRIRVPDSEDYLLIRDPGLLAEGLQEFTVEIPGGAGTRIIDVWLRDRRNRTLAWASGTVRFAGWPDFTAEPDFERTWVRANDTLNITAVLTPCADPNRTGTVVARGVDAFGRVCGLAMAPVTAEGGRVILSLPITEAETGVLKIEVTAREGAPGRFSEWDMDQGNRYVRYVSVRAADRITTFELNAAVDRAGADSGYARKLRALAEAGFSRVHAVAGEAQLLLASKEGLLFVPELVRIYAAGQGPDGRREPCLQDREYVADMDQRLREGVATHWAGGCRMYSLGWCSAYLDSEAAGSRDPRTREAFAAWLARSFENLETLNTAWQTGYGAWTDPAEQVQADWTVPGNRAPWLAWQRFTAETFMGFMAERSRTIRSTDRQGSVGFRTLTDSVPSRGCWVPDLAGTMDWLAVDCTPGHLEWLADTRAQTCRGYGVIDRHFPGWRQPGWCSWTGWLCAGLGLNGLWVESPWAGVSSAEPAAATDPEGAPTPGLAALIETAAKIRRRGALWLQAQPTAPRVLVFDSLAAHLFRLIDTEFPDPNGSSREHWTTLLNRLRVDWAFVDMTQLDRLADPSVQAVILPHCRALTDGEIAAFQEFHARGGILVADLLPGRYTEYGVRRTMPPMAELFGVQNTANDMGNPPWVEVMPDMGETPSGILRTERLTAAEGSKTAWSGNGTCCHIFSADGRALLLNYPLPPSRTAKAGTLSPAHAAIRDLLAGAGIQAEGPVPEESGSIDLITRRRTLGTIPVYFALAGPENAVQLKLPETGKGYRLMDLLAEPSRPVRGGGKVILKAGEAGLWAVIPDGKPTVAIAAPTGTEAGKRYTARILIRTAVENGDDNTGRPAGIRLTDPTGREPQWFREQVRMARNGVITLDLYFARNDPAGPWRLQVEDLLTGTTAEQIIQVTPATISAEIRP